MRAGFPDVSSESLWTLPEGLNVRRNFPPTSYLATMIHQPSKASPFCWPFAPESPWHQSTRIPGRSSEGARALRALTQLECALRVPWCFQPGPMTEVNRQSSILRGSAWGKWTSLGWVTRNLCLQHASCAACVGVAWPRACKCITAEVWECEMSTTLTVGLHT